MPKYIYKINTGATLGRDVWQGASLDELRILVYLMTVPQGASDTEITKACGTASARTKSALALWREAGVVLRESASADGRYVTERLTPPEPSPSITLEFEERPNLGVDEMDSLAVADKIRDAALAELMADIASLLSKPALNTYEAKHIAAAYEQYAVSAEYIVTLASYMAEDAAARNKGFTTKMLSDKISKLVGDGVDTLEALEAWIDGRSSDGEFYELRRIFSIWSRNPSKSEIKYFKSWTEDLGYGIEIIDEARDAAVNSTGKQPMAYINKLLISWHEAGVKTLADVDAYREKQRMERRASPTGGGGARSKAAETPAYSQFNAEDALMRALERSYGEDGED